MKICLCSHKCEMICIKTGVVLHYGNGYCYSGDAYECPNCGCQFIVTASSPYEIADIENAKKNLGKWFIEMK